MLARSARKQGFTLVEILIVVVILGILAAIVIPQFTNASQTAKASSLISQLQTLRSQLELYQVQHSGQYPDDPDDGDADTDPPTWEQMTAKTNQSGTTDEEDGELKYGPYLQKFPSNPFVSSNAWEDHVSYDSETGAVYMILPEEFEDDAEDLGLTIGTDVVLEGEEG